MRAAPADTLVIADGFSCREQVRQLTGRTPLHLAEVLRDALRARAPVEGRGSSGREEIDSALRAISAQ